MDVADERHVEQLFGVRPELVALLPAARGVGYEAGHELEDILLAVDIAEWVVVHGLLEVDGVQYAYLVPGALQKAAGLKHQLALGVGDDIGAVQLHQIGFDKKPRLARAGAADDEDVFISCGLCIFRTAVHGEPFSLRQNDVVLEFWVDVWPDVLSRTPACRAVLDVVAVLLSVLAAKIDCEPQQQPADEINTEVEGVKARKRVAERGGDRTNKAQELL